jgi:hypothetical protein
MLATKLLKSAGLTWADVLGLGAASGRKSDLPGKKARQERASLYREKPAATPLNLEPQALP